MNILCTICSDLLNQTENIFVTKCGHMFHYHCLTQWIERSRSCPQCRHAVTPASGMFRVYPTVCSEAGADRAEEQAPALRARLDDAALRVRELDAAARLKDDQLDQLAKDLHDSRELLRACEKRLASREAAASALRDQLEYVRAQSRDAQRLREENEALNKTLTTLNGVQRVLSATSSEVEQMVSGHADARTLATFVAALKRALCESESKKKESRDRLVVARRQLAAATGRIAALERTIRQCEEHATALGCSADQLSRADLPTTTDPPTCTNQPTPAGQLTPADLLTPANQCDVDDAAFHTVDYNPAPPVPIADSASPYLRLRCGAPALSLALAQGSKSSNSLKNITNTKKNPLSIFKGGKSGVADGAVDEGAGCYDGLGGRARPVPDPQGPRAKVPRLSAKHRLRRPGHPNPPLPGQLMLDGMLHK